MKKGFTLVELLVVVAILGVLAAVGIVSFGGYLGSAKVNTVKNIHNTVVTELQLAYAKCNAGIALQLHKDDGSKWDDLCKIIVDGDSQVITGFNFADSNYLGTHLSLLGFRNPYNQGMKTGDNSQQCSGMTCSMTGVDIGQSVYSIQREGDNLFILVFSRLSENENMTTTLNLSCVYGVVMPDCEIIN